MVTRGFSGHQPSNDVSNRVPPGQHLVDNFPVLSIGPAPKVSPEEWTFELKVNSEVIEKWNWIEFNALPQTSVTRDIHCVTTWSKLDTHWQGVLIDDLLSIADIDASHAFALAESFDGYTTNLPLSDLVSGKALVALQFDNKPIERDHGGPARLLVPHLYFWKSAKWISGLNLLDHEQIGFWERNGYHKRGDPWQEQRYTRD